MRAMKGRSEQSCEALTNPCPHVLKRPNVEISCRQLNLIREK